MKKVLFILIIPILLLFIYFMFKTYTKYSEQAATGRPLLGNSKSIKLADDFEGAKVKKSDLQRGCPRKDCIPSIDEPQFETVSEADEWLGNDDRIFGVVYKGVERAYAQRILNWHEIVNDEIAGDPIAMTFCPLCGTAVSFVRKVSGQTAEFGVSGFLHNSDLVMYDRLEGNLWQQITAEAIVGPAARRDEKLELLNTITATWEDWKSEHPDSQVLSKPKNFLRDYSRYPYGTYEEDGEIYFGIENSDERLHPKKVVYGIIVNEEPKAYPLDKIEAQRSFEDTIGSTTVVVEYSGDGKVTFTDKSSGEEYIPLRGFWFAWAAFNPTTQLY